MDKSNLDPLLTVGDDKSRQNIFCLLIKFYRRSPALMVLHLTGALIAWFAPDDALTRWPGLKAVVTSIGGVFPLVHKAVERSLFPDVTALYFSLMLALTPVRIFEGLRLCYSEKERIVAGYIGFSRKRRVAAFCCALFFWSGSVFFLIFDGQYIDWNFVSVAESKFWLGVIGPLFAGGYLVICFVMGVVAMLSLLYCATFNNRR